MFLSHQNVKAGYSIKKNIDGSQRALGFTHIDKSVLNSLRTKGLQQTSEVSESGCRRFFQQNKTKPTFRNQNA